MSRKPTFRQQDTKSMAIRRSQHPGSGLMLHQIPETAYTPPKSKTFRLLDLPDELVLKVLKFAVTGSSIEAPINIDLAFKRRRKMTKGLTKSCGTPRYRRGTTPLLQPAITRTCRLLRLEGLKLFYARNVFAFNPYISGATPLVQWLRCVPSMFWPRMSLFCAMDAIDWVCSCSIASAFMTTVASVEMEVPTVTMGVRCVDGRVAVQVIGGNQACRLLLGDGQDLEIFATELALAGHGDAEEWFDFDGGDGTEGG